MSYGSAEFTYTVNVDPAPAKKAPDADNTAAASSDQSPAASSDPSPAASSDQSPVASSDPSGNGDPHSRTVHNSGRTATIVIGAVCAATTVAVAAVLIIKAHNIRKTK